MRWRTGRRSSNVEDRRGMGVPLTVGGGLGTVVLLLLALFFGVDPSIVLQQDPTATYPPAGTEQSGGPQDEMTEFVSVVLADTEVNPVISALQQHNFDITALHNHLLNTSIPVWYLHFWGEGPATDLAAAVRDAIGRTKAPAPAVVMFM